MGRLAKIGIHEGRKTPVSFVLRENGVTWFDGISLLTLKQYKLEKIAENLAKGISLDIEQIRHLISNVPLPAILMLVETVRRREQLTSPMPVVAIPALSWLDTFGFAGALRETSAVLQSMDFNENFIIYIEDVDVFRLDKVAPLIQALKDIFIGVSFTAPDMSSLIQQLGSVAAKTAKGFEDQLKDILITLKEVGFDRIRGLKDRANLKLLNQLGFPINVCTLIDCYPDDLLLAKELVMLNSYADTYKIDSWFPGLKSISDGQAPNFMSDFKLLKMLAIGVITLKNIPFFRATSAYFTLEGVRTAFIFGANDFGFGAFNESAGKVLNLKPYSDLSKVFSNSETNK
ncbi:MAG: hypothetical protein KDD56_02450 [Bdellovibrionales bacterium]|nr:hypothetical protein [Bdellovibrionales bacterium]